MLDAPKKALRAAIQARLAALSPAERAAKSAAAVAHLVASAEFARARTLLLYDSMGAEVDTHALLAACLTGGKTVCLPRMAAKNRGKSGRLDRPQFSSPYAMTAHAVRDLNTDVKPQRLVFREPLPAAPAVALEQIDFVLTPGLAFDRQGHRLGRGAGCYDRFLAQPQLRAILAALAFECQIVPEIPREPHDLPVHVIFTEDRVIRV
jgi:5-formyltetrahydrofolate cyclo-ligase